MRKDVDATLEEWKSNPLDEQAFLDIARRLRERGDLERLAEVLEVRSAVVEGEERLRLLLSQAHLAELREDREGLRRYWEACARLAYRQETLGPALGRILASAELPAEVRAAVAWVRFELGTGAAQRDAARAVVALAPAASAEALEAWSVLLEEEAVAAEARSALLRGVESGQHALTEASEARIEAWAHARGDDTLLVALLGARALPSATDRAALAVARARLGVEVEAVVAELRAARGAGLDLAALDTALAEIRKVWQPAPSALLAFETEIATESGDSGRRARALLEEATHLEGAERGALLLRAARALRETEAAVEEEITALYEAGRSDASHIAAAADGLDGLVRRLSGRDREVARSMLERLCLEARQPERWRAHLADAFKGSADAERSALLGRLLDVERRLLEDPAAAAARLAEVEDLRALFDADGGLREEALALRGDLDARTTETLLNAFEAAGESDRMAGLLTELVESGDRDQSVSAALRLAALQSSVLGRADAAARTLLDADGRWEDATRVQEARLALAEAQGQDDATLALALDLSQRAADQDLRSRALHLAFALLKAKPEAFAQACLLALEEQEVLGARLDEFLSSEAHDTELLDLLAVEESPLPPDERSALARRVFALRGPAMGPGRSAGLLLAQEGKLDVAGLDALDAGLVEESAWDALLIVRSRAHELDVSPARALALSEILSKSGRPEIALDTLVEALEAHPDDAALDAGIRNFARETENWPKLIERLEAGAAKSERGEEARIADMDALAALFAETLGRDDLSLQWRVKTLRLRENPSLLQELRDGLRDRTAQRILRDAIEFAVEHGGDTPEARHAGLAYEAAALHLDRDGDVERGRALLSLALPVESDVQALVAARLLAQAEHLSAQEIAQSLKVLEADRGKEWTWGQVLNDAEGATRRGATAGARTLLAAARKALGDPEGLGALALDVNALCTQGETAEAVSLLEAPWRERALDAAPDLLERFLDLLVEGGESSQALLSKVLCEELRRRPLDASLRERAASCGEGTRCAEALEEAAAQAGDADEARNQRHAAALLWRGAEEAERALALWQQNLEADADDGAALNALAELLADATDPEPWRAVQRRIIAHATQPDRVLQAHWTLVEVAADEDAKREALEALLAFDAEDRKAARQLIRLLRNAQDFEAMATAQETLAEAEDLETEERVTLLWTASRAWTGPLENRERAADLLWKVLALDPTHERALDELERNLRQREDHPGRARLLAHRIEHEPQSALLLDMLRELARLQEEVLEDHEAAIRSLEEVVSREPGNLPVLEEIARLHGEEENWKGHLHALERMSSATGIRALRAEIYLRAAEVLHRHMDNHERSLDLLAEASEAITFRPEQIEMAREVAESGELWKGWANLLRRFAKGEQDRRRSDQLWAELGHVWAERLEDPRAGLTLLGERFSEQPRLGPVLDAMEEIAQAHGMREQLLPAYAALKENARGNEEVLWRALHQSASIAEDVLRVPDRAFAVLVEAARIPSARERAEAELDRLAKAHELWTQHTAYLESRWQDIEDVDESTNALLRKAEIEEGQLGDWEAAFETLIAAFQSAPTNPRVREPLNRLADAHGQWELVLRLHEALQRSASDVASRKLYLVQMADIYETRLDRLGDAFEQVLRAWECDASDDALRERLAHLAERTERLPDLLRAYQWQAENTEDAEGRVAALDRVLRLAEHLSDGAAALEACATLCSNAPADEGGRLELARIASTYDLRREEIAIVDRLLEGSLPATERIPWLAQKLAAAEALSDTSLRIAVLEQLVQEAPEDEAWIERRNRALLDAGRVDRLTETLRARLDATAEADEALAIAAQLAELLLTEGNAPEEAVTVLDGLCERFPEHLPARTQLLDFLEAAEAWEELVARLLAAAAEVDAPALARSWRLRAAAVAEEYLADPERTLAAADAQLELEAGDPEALEVRARALAMQERWEEHIATLHALSRQLEGRAAGIALVEAAMASWRMKKDLPRAFALLAEAGEVAPDAMEPLVATGDLFAHQKRHDEAASAYERALGLPGASSAQARERAEVLHRLAMSLETLPNRLADAVQALEEATTTDPAHTGARDDWRRLARGLVSNEDVEARLTEAIERTEDESERLRAIVERGIWRLGEGDDPAGAREDLLAVDVTNAESARWLVLSADAALLAGAYSDAMARYEGVIAAWGDATLPSESPSIVPGEQRSSPLSLVAALRRNHALELAGDLDGAFEGWTDLALENEGCAAAIAGQARIMDAQGNLPGAARFAMEALDATGEEEAEAKLVAEMRVILARNAAQDGRNDDELGELVVALDTGVPLPTDLVERAYELAAATRDPALSLQALHALADQRLHPNIRARVLLEIARHRMEASPGDPGSLAPISEALAVADADDRVLEQAATMLLETEQPDTAVELLEALLARGATGATRSRLSLTLAELLRRQERFEAAAPHFHQALEDSPQSASALRGLVDARRRTGSYEELAKELGHFLTHIPEDATSVRAQVLRALGDVLLHDLERVSESRPIFEELHTIFPSDVRVLEALLRIYEDDSTVEAAEGLRISYELLKQGVLSDDMLTSLERLHYSRDNIDGVLQVLQIRKLAAVASDEELELLGSLPSESPPLAAGSLDDAFYDSFLAPASIDAAVRRHVQKAAQRVLEAQPEDRPEGLQPLPSETMIAALLPAVAEATGHTEVEAYLDPTLEAGIRALAQSPPLLLVSAEAAAEREEAIVRFLLGRALAMARPEAVFLHALGPFEFMTFLEAALRPLVQGETELDSDMEGQVDTWRERIGDLERPERFARVARHRLPAAGTWREAFEATGVRAGLVAGFDSYAVLRRMVEEHDASMPTSVADLEALVARFPEIRALVSYVLSDRYLGARRKLGLVLAPDGE